jgi:AbrB family looped-hinge helix DNA binding protein
MKEIIATLSSKGQVTIPAEVRKRLGLTSGDKLVFEIEDDQVRIKPVTFTLESAYGSVEPLHRPEDFDRLIREAKAERAARKRES